MIVSRGSGEGRYPRTDSMGSQGATRSFPTTSWWIPVFLRRHLFFIGLREHFQETVVFTRVYASWSTSWYKKTCSNGVLVRKKCKWTHFYVANLNEHIFFWDLFQTCLSISYLLNHIGLVSSICPHMSSNLHVYHAELFILPGSWHIFIFVCTQRGCRLYDHYQVFPADIPLHTVLVLFCFKHVECWLFWVHPHIYCWTLLNSGEVMWTSHFANPIPLTSLAPIWAMAFQSWWGGWGTRAQTPTGGWRRLWEPAAT